MTIAPKRKMSIQDMQRAANNYGQFALTTKWDGDTPVTAEEEANLPSLLER